MISVLLVEDEPEVLELTRLFLERDTELSIDTCLSVDEALRKLNHKVYNVIVTDYVMPEMNGIQLLKTLKFRGIDTPLIIFTGKGDEEIAIEALNLGAAFYLQKSENPRFQFAKLRKMIYEAALKQRTEEKYRENNICVVIPAFNEEKHIGPTLDSVPDYIFRIYAVDDASTDQTAEIIRKYAENDSRIMLIRHDKNKGVGASVASGYRESLKDGMDIAVVMTGDNQMDPAYLPAFLDPIVKRQADYTVGNRLPGPEYRKGMPKWRFFWNALLTLFTKIASGYWQLMDPQNNYTAISKRALERIDPNTIYPRYGYCNDILVRLNTYSYKAVNVNHPARYDRGEKSGIRYHTYIFRLTGLLFKDFLWRMKEKYLILNFHPLVFFYFFGIICILTSLFLGVYALYEKIFGMEPLFIRATLAMILLFMGSMFILFAWLFDMEQERNIGMY
ncbi:MAG: glycosyltransferase [Methanoregula sp.]|jgi:glycosyltransferase involved in cell wall biosynthesis/FixJ family two-component response regulator